MSCSATSKSTPPGGRIVGRKTTEKDVSRPPSGLNISKNLVIAGEVFFIFTVVFV
jgi:hypothetical protein